MTLVLLTQDPGTACHLGPVPHYLMLGDLVPPHPGIAHHWDSIFFKLNTPRTVSVLSPHIGSCFQQPVSQPSLSAWQCSYLLLALEALCNKTSCPGLIGDPV